LGKLVKLVPPDIRLRLKCTKFDFRWGSIPDPAGGAYSTPPDPLAVFKRPTSTGREREEEGKGGEGRGRELRDKIHFLGPISKGREGKG